MWKTIKNISRSLILVSAFAPLCSQSFAQVKSIDPIDIQSKLDEIAVYSREMNENLSEIRTNNAFTKRIQIVVTQLDKRSGELSGQYQKCNSLRAGAEERIIKTPSLAKKIRTGVNRCFSIYRRSIFDIEKYLGNIDALKEERDRRSNESEELVVINRDLSNNIQFLQEQINFLKDLSDAEQESIDQSDSYTIEYNSNSTKSVTVELPK